MTPAAAFSTLTSCAGASYRRRIRAVPAFVAHFDVQSDNEVHVLGILERAAFRADLGYSVLQAGFTNRLSMVVGFNIGHRKIAPAEIAGHFMVAGYFCHFLSPFYNFPTKLNKASILYIVIGALTRTV
jgi:hypothetical protein